MRRFMCLAAGLILCLHHAAAAAGTEIYCFNADVPAGGRSHLVWHFNTDASKKSFDIVKYPIGTSDNGEEIVTYNSGTEILFIPKHHKLDKKDIGYCVILTIEDVTKDDEGTYKVLLLGEQANNNKPCNLSVNTGGNSNQGQAYSPLTKTLCNIPEDPIIAALGTGGVIGILVTLLVLVVFFLACAVCFWCKNSKRRKQKRAMRESIKQLHVISEDQDKALKEALLKKTTDTTDRGTETVLDTRDMSANTDKTGRVDRECNTDPVVITYPGSANTHPMAITYPGNSNTHPMAITYPNSSNASGANVSRPLPQPFDHARPQSLYLVQPQPPTFARCQSLTLPPRQANTKKNRTHSASVANGPSVTTPLSSCALAEEEDDSSYTLLKENGRSSLWGREGTYNKIQ